MSVKKRIEYLDVCKGIGIIFVIAGHVMRTNPLITWIYSFHMPMFFILSGFIFYFDHTSSFKAFFMKKIRTIVVPYLFFGAITYIYWVLVERGLRPGNVALYKPLIGILYGIGKEPWLTFNDVLWFLACLFVVEIVFFIIAKHLKKTLTIISILLISSVIGYFIGQFHLIDLPWGINIAFTAIVFYGFGYLLNKHNIVRSAASNSKMFLFILLAIYAVSTYFNQHVDLNTLTYNNYFLFYLAAANGSLAVILISKHIKHSSILTYLGKNSLIIMCVHEPLKRIVLGILIYVTKIPLNNIRDSYFGILFSTILTIAFSLPFIFLLNRFLPFFVGKSLKRQTKKLIY